MCKSIDSNPSLTRLDVTLLLPQELAGVVKNARTAFERYKTYMTNLEAKETLEKQAAAEVDKEKRGARKRGQGQGQASAAEVRRGGHA